MTNKQILEDNRSNFELMRELVQECNSYDGSLEGYEAYDFDDDFFQTYFEGRPEEAARAVFFGNVQNWMDDYIRLNGYGNLETLSDYQYAKELEEGADEIITEALRLAEAGNIDLDEILERHDLKEQ